MSQEKNTPKTSKRSRFGDEPAYPSEHKYGQVHICHSGLTKREVISKDLMATLMIHLDGKTNFQDYARYSIKAADALLAELNKDDGHE